MVIELRPLSPAIGAEVIGVDLRCRMSGRLRDDILAAWHEHLVLLFRDQTLSTEHHLQFARSFGELERVRTRPQDGDDAQYVMFVANTQVEGKEGVLPDGEMYFHSDQCYYERPCKGTTLYAIEVPPTGGNTLFSNTQLAWSTLTQELKHVVWGRRALNVYDYDAGATKGATELSCEAPRFIHPIVVRHPDTGRLALYVNRLMTVEIEGIGAGESAATLQRLFDHQEQKEFGYEHVWRPRDLVIWDNRASLHARTHFDPSRTRILRRVTIRGDRPAGAEGAVPA